MLQYLTDDLMPGYGLPKKRMAVDVWSLRDSGLFFGIGRYSTVHQNPDVVAIGQMVRNGYVYALHSDRRMHIISTNVFYDLKWCDLYRYLE